MASLLIFGIIALIALILFFKTTGVRFGKTWTFVIGFLILFVALSFSFVLIQTQSNVASIDGATVVVRAYFAWLGSFIDNLGSISGNVVNSNWTGNLTS